MPIDNYEQNKRIINHWETIHAYIYIERERETKKLFDCALQINRAIKLPPNQKRERTTGKKRLKGHGPGHTQFTRLHNNYLL